MPRNCAPLCAALPEVLEGEPLAAEGGASPHVRVYRPPTEEFEIRCVTAPPSSSQAATVVPLDASAGPQLLLVQSGRALGRAVRVGGGAAEAEAALEGAGLEAEVQLQRGSVVLVPAGTRVELVLGAAVAGEGQAAEPLRCWVAAVNATFLALHDALGSSGAVAVAEAAAAAVDVPTEAVCVAHLAQSNGGVSGAPGKQAFAPSAAPAPAAVA